MNRPLFTLLAAGLSLIPAVAAAETLPLPLSGPAYTAASSGTRVSQPCVSGARPQATSR